jgi:hypothetical protein
VANGYVIEIEDGGLGIPDEIMGRLNVRLAQAPDFDLADSDQLGLFVVSRLAARHQIKVSLRTSGYGGTLAVVLLPHTLVVSEEETVFLAAEAARPASGRPAGPSGPGGTGPHPVLPARPPAHARPSAPNGAERAGALPARQPAGRGPSVPAARGPRVPGGAAQAARALSGPSMPPGQPAELPSAAQFTPSVPTAPTTPSGMPALSELPRREPMANMAPQLRASRAEVPQSPVAGRSPEQARALLSAIRTGWRTGVAESNGLDMTSGNGAQQDINGRRPEDSR